MNNLTSRIETLRAFQSAVLKEHEKRTSKIESRRKWYEDAATRFLGKPVDVKFLEQPLDEFGNLLNGSIVQINGRYVIEIKSNRPIKNERFTWAHEVTHAALGHALDGTPEEYEQGKITKEVFLNGAMDKATGTDARKLFVDASSNQENETDRIASQLCKMLWPE